MDLRREPKALELEARQVVVAEKLPSKTAHTLPVCGIISTILHFESGNLLVLDIEGFKLALTAGRLQTGAPLQVDLLFAGSGAPGSVQAGTIISAKEYAWQNETEDTRFYYAPQQAEAQLRPGRSVRLQGGSYAVQ